MKKISVVVPIYNVEKYLEECINSIINQSYKNLEILLIDDGSTDNCLNICQKYAKIDSRIIVIHKNNGGLSSARNIGLENSTGDYVMFIDSDDMYLLNSCEILEREIELKQADFIIGNYKNTTDNGIPWDKPVFAHEKFIDCKLDVNEYKTSFYLMNSSVCNKIFDLNFINKLGLKFVEKVPAEDAIFSTYAFMNSKKVYYISDVIYLYRQRTSNSISTNCCLNYFDGISNSYNIIYKNFLKYNKMNFYKCFYVKSLNYITYKYIDSNNLSLEERKFILKKLNWFYKLNEILIIPSNKILSKFINFVAKENYLEALKESSKLKKIRCKMNAEERELMVKPSIEEYFELFESIGD